MKAYLLFQQCHFFYEIACLHAIKLLPVHRQLPECNLNHRAHSSFQGSQIPQVSQVHFKCGVVCQENVFP